MNISDLTRRDFLKTTAVGAVGVFAAPLVAPLTATSCRQIDRAGYPVTPVPFTSVKVTDDFWGQRLTASREVTIPLAFSKLEETGRIEFCESRKSKRRPQSRISLRRYRRLQNH